MEENKLRRTHHFLRNLERIVSQAFQRGIEVISLSKTTINSLLALYPTLVTANALVPITATLIGNTKQQFQLQTGWSAGSKATAFVIFQMTQGGPNALWYSLNKATLQLIWSTTPYAGTVRVTTIYRVLDSGSASETIVDYCIVPASKIIINVADNKNIITPNKSLSSIEALSGTPSPAAVRFLDWQVEVWSQDDNDWISPIAFDENFRVGFVCEFTGLIL